jgi:hypothetical protein
MLRVLAVLSAALPAAAQAAGSCTAHDDMVRHLAEGWGESRQAIALDSGSAMVEVYANADTGTWTLTVTQPGGPTCMVASGQAFEMVKEELPVLDEGA